MSFVYAQLTQYYDDGIARERISVYSDTRIILPNTSGLLMNDLTQRATRAFGVCKIHIHDGKYCVSFVGNDISKAHKLLQWLVEGNCESFDSLVQTAFKIHCSAANKDDVEFILCAAQNDDGVPEIAYVKEGALARGVENAWIGSYEAFRQLQKALLERKGSGAQASVSLDQMYKAIYSCDDETVGDLIICANTYGGKFEYGYCYFTAVYREQSVPPGGKLRLFQSADEGGFAVEIREIDGDPFLTFPQIGRSLLYTARIHYQGEPSVAPPMNLIRLPILMEAETGIVLDPGFAD